MTKEISLFNRQKKFKIYFRKVRPLVGHLLGDCLKLSEWNLSIVFLGPKSITKWNEEHLQHKGPADILTYDYSNNPNDLTPLNSITGELLICPQVAFEISQKYGKSWPNELSRYMVHGILHLLGYDDINPKDRKIMKRAENKWMKHLETQFDLDSIGCITNDPDKR